MPAVWRVRAAMVAAVAAFEGRPDTVILKNADRISGEVLKLENNKLVIKTEYAGTIQVDWSAVERLQSGKRFRVEVENQRQLTGLVAVSPRGVNVISGDDVVSVDPLRVVAMAPAPESRPEPGFWRALEGSVDVGYSLARGNSRLNQSSLGVRAQYRAPAWRAQADASSLFSRQPGSPSTSRHAGSLRLDRFLGTETFVFALSSLERDERQLLDLRTNLGGGFGWKVVRSPRTELSLLGGATFVNEDFRRRAPEELARGGSSGESLVGYSLERAVVGRAVLTSKASAFRNFFGPARYRITFDSGLRVPVAGPFSWSLRLFDRFDSRPPERVVRNDYGVISSFGVAF
ncbi:MAG: DUF481 domain-containing protein [Bryobacteraceae bacterium]|nr:DUF481 domain-containing protein [Bryobacteraceae bacterium]